MRQILSMLVAATVCLMSVPATGAAEPASQRLPNILWLVSEDNGPFLGCYGDAYAKTPNLDRLASQGILYTNAFANAPVCAPSRCTLLTGVYASSLGTHGMRSRYDIPSSIRFHYRFLQDAGYYCMNPGKTDYNIRGNDKAGWDDGAEWSANRRKPGMPFFLIRNFETTHESSLHNSKLNEADLREPLKLPPYHPDTPVIRSNWVDYYRKVTAMDAAVGQWLDRLEKDGLAEDTIVFYYSDHGGILPRSKRFLYESGTRIPLIVRFPKKWQHLAPAAPGSKVDRLVSLVDLAPTLLNLIGMKPPSHMQGRAFLGPDLPPEPQYIFGFRGRMDERIDLSYTLRDKRYRYIRNYLPHRPHFQPLIYLWLMPAMRSWETEFKAGRCDAIQSAPWLDKPAEELFDIAADPHNVKNLAGDPAHAEALRRMRAALRAQLIENRDAALVPESILLAAVETDAGGRLIRSYTQDTRRYPVERIIDAADLASARDERNLPKLIELLANKDPAIQYWGAVGCVALGERAAPAADVLDAQLEHAAPAVQIAAAEALCRLGRSQPRAMDVLIGFATSRTKGATADAVANEALNALEALGGRAARAADAILAAAPYENEYQNRAASSLVAKFGKTLPGAPKP